MTPDLWNEPYGHALDVPLQECTHHDSPNYGSINSNLLSTFVPTAPRWSPEIPADHVIRLLKLNYIPKHWINDCCPTNLRPWEPKSQYLCSPHDCEFPIVSNVWTFIKITFATTHGYCLDGVLHHADTTSQASPGKSTMNANCGLC